MEKTQSLIERFATRPIICPDAELIHHSHLARDEDELAQLQAERRPGRPTSAREDLLKQRRKVEELEYVSGYWMPDMQDEANLAALRGWNGDWANLNALKFTRLFKSGKKAVSSFPPKGQS